MDLPQPFGRKEIDKYGNITLNDIENVCKVFAKKNNLNLSLFQSNIEGEPMKN